MVDRSATNNDENFNPDAWLPAKPAREICAVSHSTPARTLAELVPAAQETVAAESPQQQGRAPFVVTVVTAKEPKRLSKRFVLQDGKAVKQEGGGRLYVGEACRVELQSLEEFNEIVLSNLAPDNALMFGVAAEPNVALVSRKRAAKMGKARNGLPVVTRTRKCVAWSEGAVVMMVDYDPRKDEAPLSDEQFLEKLYRVAPALRDAPHIIRPSGSTYIFDSETGEQLRGAGGLRVYFVLRSGANEEVVRAGNVLFDRLWLAGHGHIAISKSGSMLVRAEIDNSVYQPERLDFAAGADCGPGLERRPPEIRIINPDAPWLDSAAALPNLSEAETDRLDKLIASAKDRARPEAEAAKQHWIDENTEAELAGVEFENDEECDNAQALIRDKFRAAVEDGKLYGDFVLHVRLESGKEETVTVGRTLDNPGIYHNAETRDPLEPGYRDGAYVGKLFLRGRPTLHSFAHGEKNYTLIRARKQIFLAAGHVIDTVAKVKELMKIDGTCYVRSGELVRIIDGRIVRARKNWLWTYLHSVAEFMKKGEKEEDDGDGGKTVEFKPCNAPKWIADSIFDDGVWGLPHIVGVADSPKFEPMTGRIISEYGFDAASGLFLDISETFDEIDPNVGEAEAEKAFYRALRPFLDFPLNDSQGGDISRGSMLCALFMAVSRQLLPTAPAIIVTAPVAASGKSYLAHSIAGYATKRQDALMPARFRGHGAEEEMVKRLFTIANSGKPATLIDNITGEIDSESLNAFLTSESFCDRKMGTQEDASASTNTLMLFTGNNANIVGDLNRRLLRINIDPGVEEAHKRKFDINPIKYTRQNRASLIRDTLIVLRAWHNAGRPQFTKDCTGSFEGWSDTCRQAVLWCAEMGWISAADPALSFDEGYGTDPEKQELFSLLSAWGNEIGYGAAVTCAELSEHTEMRDGDLRAAFEAMGLVIRDGELKARSVGKKLQHLKDRIAGGLCLRCGERNRLNIGTWFVERVDE